MGWELCRTAPPEVVFTACTSAELDISDKSAMRDFIAADCPDVVINAAAYTAVDRAEDDAARAFAVNRNGVANLAAVCADNGIKIIHVSTDFVFDGLKSSPYLVNDLPKPTGIYGESKLAGENSLLEINPNSTIIRTAWVYSAHGNNFVKTMLRLMAELTELGVVADQIGTPTWANGLAQALWDCLDKGFCGIYHWTDAGVASWFDFACAIQEEAIALGLLQKNIPVKPLRTVDYPTPAHRPPYSVLDKTSLWGELGYNAPHWRVNLRKMLQEM